MKKKISYNIMNITGICMAALLLLAVGIEADEMAQITDDTIVYYTPGKQRCHLADCKRRSEGMSTMTWAEAKAKNLPLCSRCPGSTTPAAPKKTKKPKTSAVSQSSATAQAGEVMVYYVPGKKRCHLAGCKRRTEGMSTMTLAEAKAKGLSLCSKCPTNTTTSASAAP